MTVAQVTNTVEGPYRWMDQSVKARSYAAADRGDLLESKIYTQVEKIAAERESGDAQYFVGRVTSEIVEDEKDPKVAINTHSLMLESTQERRVRLIINECNEYILFSGQIVGAVGRMMGDNTHFHADTLVCGPALPAVRTGSAVLTAPVHVTFASGPYSPDSDLVFDSISELEVRVREQAPDKLVLMGPFLDVNHPVIASGTVEDSFGRAVTFEDVYRQEIIPKLARLARACETARTELIIVPALTEARFDFPLPQPPLNTSAAPIWASLVKELPASVVFASNPARITIGDVSVMVTSTDALSSVNTNILFKQSTEDPTALGRLDACMDQLLRSRCLFPVMPSGLRIEPAMRGNLEITDDSQLPHIVVVPSLSGKRFIKKISGRVFVNPGFMSDASGTNSSIAEIVIGPSGGEPENLYARITGDLVKL